MQVALDTWNKEFPAVSGMPDDLFFAMESGGGPLFCLRCGGAPVGVALLDADAPFLIPYILPAYRRQGIGTAAVRALEQRLPGRAMTSYRRDDAGAAAFAAAMGYGYRFSSACMTYTGAAFPRDTLDVRGYADGDYDAAHALYADAFHRMRVSVGDFPDSVPEPPNDAQRRDWAATADERLVCLRDGAVVGVAHILGQEIGSVAISPDCQRQGIGRRFVKDICRRILSAGHAQVVLYCVVGNGARNLYDQLGFTERGVDVYAVRRWEAR